MKKLVFAATAAAAAPSGAAADVEPVEINEEELVEQALRAEIAPAVARPSVYRVRRDGDVEMVPGTGSITYNFRTGDSAVDMAGNHVEPAVSVYNPGRADERGSAENRALSALATIGSPAQVTSGEAEGAEGWVIGTHGGVEHVMVDFPGDVYDDLVIGDEIQIRGRGAGMELEGAADVEVMNASPRLIEALAERGLGVTDEGQLRVGVTHRIPARVMGSGLGQDHAYTGDYDIQLADDEINERFDLDTLRFGDIVAIVNADHSYGRTYRQGAITVGVVVHGESGTAGHGPGVTTLFTSSEGAIEFFRDRGANLKTLLEIPD